MKDITIGLCYEIVLPEDGSRKFPKKYGIELKRSVDFEIADFKIVDFKIDLHKK
jgi:hypothetical protein